jgi:hypothetical protein
MKDKRSEGLGQSPSPFMVNIQNKRVEGFANLQAFPWKAYEIRK